MFGVLFLSRSSKVTANDPDTDTNGLVTYSLEPLPGEENQTAVTDMFTIDGESGWITTVREADCEATRLYRFNVMASDHGGQVKLSSSVLVEVTVTDENDSPPRFLQEAYRGSVLESAEPGEVVVTMTTTDGDVSLENRLVTCYITGELLAWSECVCSVNGVWWRTGIYFKNWPVEAVEPQITSGFQSFFSFFSQ